MDTCFPLLQPKHHCVKVTGERPRETNQSQECGRRAGREASKTRPAERGNAPLLTGKGVAEGGVLSLSARRRVRGRTFTGSRRAGGQAVLKVLWKGGCKGATVSSRPLVVPLEPPRWLGILLRRLRVDRGDASHGESVLQVDSTGLLL